MATNKKSIFEKPKVSYYDSKADYWNDLNAYVLLRELEDAKIGRSRLLALYRSLTCVDVLRSDLKVVSIEHEDGGGAYLDVESMTVTALPANL